MKKTIVLAIAILTILSVVILSGCSQYKQPSAAGQPTESTPLDQDVQALDQQTVPDGSLDNVDSDLTQIQKDLDA